MLDTKDTQHQTPQPYCKTSIPTKLQVQRIAKQRSEHSCSCVRQSVVSKLSGNTASWRFEAFDLVLCYASLDITMNNSLKKDCGACVVH
eukprot:6167272-Amphidinium_carterae.1